jgi:multidrug efflux system membrane fusion protein
VAAVAVVAVFALFSRFFLHSGKTDQPPAPPLPTPVVGATARTGALPIYLTGLGTVTAFNTVIVRSRVDGELLKVPVQEGQIVAAGELIAEIDPRPFEVQLLQAQGQLERDQAILENAKVDLTRYRVLAAQDAIPKQQYDTQVANVNQAEATVKADRGPVENAKLQLIYTRITSPIPGRIGLRQIDPGNIVHATDANGIATITQLQPISVIFNINEDNVGQVSKKLQAGQRLSVEAYDRDLKTKIAVGSLLTIDNQVDVTSGTVRFKAVFPNEDNALFPNQFVNARLLLEMKRGAVLVPAAAIQRGPQNNYVYVIAPDDTAQVRNVVVGPIAGDTASIDRGLSAGETVVTEGVDKLQPGAKVSVRASP